VVGNTAAPANRRSNRRRASLWRARFMALPHERHCLPANAEGFRARVAKSNRFRIARPPKALPLPVLMAVAHIQWPPWEIGFGGLGRHELHDRPLHRLGNRRTIPLADIQWPDPPPPPPPCPSRNT
jgi:hypothetical protein